MGYVIHKYKINDESDWIKFTIPESSEDGKPGHEFHNYIVHIYTFIAVTAKAFGDHRIDYLCML